MKKIAFCFLIYNEINHEELWNIFFKNIDKNKYNIYIHYKSNKPLKYFENYKINNCIETKYEDQTIPLAYNILFRRAYNEDIENYKFIIVSGSCIPLKCFNFIYSELTKDNYGYFNVCPNVHYLSKSSNWFILNRILVEQLCFDKDNILNIDYKSVYAPAEYFYYTYIKLLQLESEIITTANSSNDATTFTNWGDMDYKYVNSHNGLKNYNFISDEELTYLLNSKCFFGRKFNKECVLNNKFYIYFITQ